jgi:tRNA A-37 threonylcarbamoyl transferase component Bud32
MDGPVDVAGTRFWICPEAGGAAPGAERLAALVADLEAGRLANRKSSRRKALHAVSLAPGGAPDHLLKVNRYAGLDAWRHRFAGSKARREVTRARAVARRGIPTPLPVAWGERSAGGRLRACFLLVPLLRGAADLEALERAPDLSPGERRALARAFGALARRVHDAGVYQDDFAPNNFLARRGTPPELWMIDFERVRLRRGPVSERERLHMLGKLERRVPGASAAERVEFLRAYEAGDRAALRARWRALAELAPRLARHDLARAARTASHEGRRFTIVRAAGVRGWARRDAPPAALVAGEGGGVGLWRVRRPASRARELWAAGNLLWLRGLGPLPLACLVRGGEAELRLARAPGEAPLVELAEPGRASAALAKLVGRLLALGALEAPAPTEIVMATGARGGLTALLAAPDRLRVGTAAPPGARLALARGLTRALLEGCARS